MDSDQATGHFEMCSDQNVTNNELLIRPKEVLEPQSIGRPTSNLCFPNITDDISSDLQRQITGL